MMTVSTIGLALAAGTSVVNILTDVCRKKAVRDNDVIGTWFWISCSAASVFSIAFLVRLISVPGPILHPAGPIFVHLWGGFGADWPSAWKFAFCLLFDGALETAGLYLYLRALQVSDLSISVPFLAFTPVLLIPSGYFLLHEAPNLRQMLGVLLVLCGSLAINRQAFRSGVLGAFKAIFHERGSRYMLLVAVCFAITNPVDKMIVLMSDANTAAFGYGLTILLFYTGLMVAGQRRWLESLKEAPKWIILAGVLYALTQLLQFTSHRYIDVVLTITIKRAGIILSVIAGWLIFREKHIEDRLVAATAMLSGVILIYLPLSTYFQVSLAVAMIALLAWNIVRGNRQPAAS